MAGPMTLFDVAGRAMSSQLVRMNGAASNIANAGSVAASEDAVYRPLKTVFQTEYDRASNLATVNVARVVATDAAATREHDPDHPLADADGYLWKSPVDETQEMVEVMEASRQYSNLVDVLQTAKQLMLDTLGASR